MLASQMDADPAVYGWNQFRIGPWLRGERVKRSYSKFFDPKNRYSTWIKYQLAKRFSSQQISYEQKDQSIVGSKPFHVFNNPWIEESISIDQFQNLRGHEDAVRQGLMDMIRPEFRRLIDQAPAPALAIHVRRGDYSTNTVGRYVTPDSYFTDAIRSIRDSCNEDIPVTIFSDAWPAELEEILAIPNVKLGAAQPDIVDLIQMSKSKFIVTSHGSTFGYWAGYLSKAAVILNERHVTGRIRSESVPYFEGTIDQYCDLGD